MTSWQYDQIRTNCEAELEQRMVGLETDAEKVAFLKEYALTVATALYPYHYVMRNAAPDVAPWRGLNPHSSFYLETDEGEDNYFVFNKETGKVDLLPVGELTAENVMSCSEKCVTCSIFPLPDDFVLFGSSEQIMCGTCFNGYITAGDVRHIQEMLKPHDVKADSTLEIALLRFLSEKWEHSQRVFGPQTTTGVLNHVRSEVEEIQEEPTDITEWVDLILLGMDGAMRSCPDPKTAPQEVVRAIRDKFEVVKKRQYPDWRTLAPDEASYHEKD